MLIFLGYVRGTEFLSAWKQPWSSFIKQEVRCSLSSSFPACLLLIAHLRPSDVARRTRAGNPAFPVTPVTFLISSELFSMPPVKRFSVSFARHPTNGMSAFVHLNTPQCWPCMTFSWRQHLWIFISAGFKIAWLFVKIPWWTCSGSCSLADWFFHL